MKTKTNPMSTVKNPPIKETELIISCINIAITISVRTKIILKIFLALSLHNSEKLFYIK